MLTDRVKANCRQIDCVSFKGNVQQLYTVDLCFDELEVVKEKKEKKTPQQMKADRVRHRVQRNKYKRMCF